MAISHSFHMEHELSLTTEATQFRCDGCNQFGQGPGHYRCQPCNFDLHKECALPVLSEVGGFVFVPNHTTQNGHMACKLCAGETIGFRYFNQDHNLYFHPCCLFLLPSRVVQDGRVFQLCQDHFLKCGMCENKSNTACYRTSYDDGVKVYLHVSCLVRSHNALTGYQNWQPSAPIIRDVLGSFTRPRQHATAPPTAMARERRGRRRAALRAVGSSFHVGLHIGLIALHVVALDPVGIAESAASVAESTASLFQ
ncbi:hypothetical protein ACQ4PT_017105 [Festuca glaucescens]